MDTVRTLNSIRQEYISVVWTHKIQEVQSDIYSISNTIFKVINIIVVALSTCGIITFFFMDELYIKIITSILSTFSLTLVLFNYEFSFTEKIRQYKICATKLVQKRDDLRLIMLRYEDGNISFNDFLKEYKELSLSIHEIYNEAPHTGRLAVNIARKRLMTLGESSVSNEEIEKFIKDKETV